jgi:hypothetical protein
MRWPVALHPVSGTEAVLRASMRLSRLGAAVASASSRSPEEEPHHLAVRDSLGGGA